MQHCIEKGGMPLAPHHTQVIAMLMFSQFYEMRHPEKGSPTVDFDTAFLQMQTGEGKSIVIAMLAVFVVRRYGMRVHVLENNEVRHTIQNASPRLAPGFAMTH